jgi:Tfp pilus assembly protein PilO
MDRLAWTVKRQFINLRWTGALGLALLLCAAALYVFGIAPATERLAQLSAERVELSARLGTRGQQRQPVTQSSQLSNFYAFFPSTSTVSELLRSIESAAQANALLLQKGEYRLSQERQFRLARYQVTLPVRGAYTDVRGFVNDVLEAVPAAALEDLTLKREQIGDPQIEARVRFTLYLGTR